MAQKRCEADLHWYDDSLNKSGCPHCRPPGFQFGTDNQGKNADKTSVPGRNEDLSDLKTRVVNANVSERNAKTQAMPGDGRSPNIKTQFVNGNQGSSDAKTRVVMGDYVAPSANESHTNTEQKGSSSNKTRIVTSDGTHFGHSASEAVKQDATAGQNSSSPNSSHQDLADAVVGWLVITQGPGLGKDFAIKHGRNSIGRSQEMRVCLDFGDEAISRDGHAYVIFDPRSRGFFLEDGGKSVNLIYLNGEPISGRCALKDRDRIEFGYTELAFVSFCDATFNW